MQCNVAAVLVPRVLTRTGKYFNRIEREKIFNEMSSYNLTYIQSLYPKRFIPDKNIIDNRYIENYSRNLEILKIIISRDVTDNYY